MRNLLNRTDRRGWLANVTCGIGAALLLNGIILAAGWMTPSPVTLTLRPDGLPPDPVIGIVWTALFAVMATCRWQLLRVSASTARWTTTCVASFMAWCLAYPFLTEGLQSVPLGLFVNGITVGLNAALCAALWSVSRSTVWAMTLPAAWVAFASVELIRFGRVG